MYIFLFSNPCSHKCGLIYTHFNASIQKSKRLLCDCVLVMRDVSRASYEFRRSESKKAKLEELSNNIGERRYELKTNRAGEERSDERVAILSDTLVRSRRRVTGLYAI